MKALAKKLSRQSRNYGIKALLSRHYRLCLTAFAHTEITLIPYGITRLFKRFRPEGTCM